MDEAERLSDRLASSTTVKLVVLDTPEAIAAPQEEAGCVSFVEAGRDKTLYAIPGAKESREEIAYVPSRCGDLAAS